MILFRSASGQRRFHAARWFPHAVDQLLGQRVLRIRHIRFILAIVLVRVDLQSSKQASVYQRQGEIVPKPRDTNS